MGANPTLLTLFYSRDNEIYIYGQQKLENDELEQQWYQFEGSLVTKENGVRRSTRGNVPAASTMLASAWQPSSTRRCTH